MKSLFAILFAAILFSQILVAQENSVKFGFGVNFTREIVMTSYDYDLGIYSLPIDLANFSAIIRGEHFRVEPSLGYFSTSSEDVYESGRSKYSTSNFRLGMLAAYNDNSTESMNFYYGFVLGFIFSSYHSEATSTETIDRSKTDFFVGPAVGGEYMISKHFSFGGEININYISLGQYSDGEQDIGDHSDSAISSRGIIYVRWYVN